MTFLNFTVLLYHRCGPKMRPKNGKAIQSETEGHVRPIPDDAELQEHCSSSVILGLIVCDYFWLRTRSEDLFRSTADPLLRSEERKEKTEAPPTRPRLLLE
jgi:hypothetical protein